METHCDEYLDAIKIRLRIKKAFNSVVCVIVFILGILATIYKVKYEGSFLTCLRELTVDGTLFASAVALMYAFINFAEIILDKEFEHRFLYYLRLSSCVGEFIILIVVLIGYLPIVPDHPVITRFDMINMHVIIPLLTILSFVFHDPPIGKLKPSERFYGLIFISLYCVIMMTFIFTGIVPENKIPYSFMNIYSSPIWYIIFAAVFVFTLGYLISWALSELNRKASWLWFKNIAKK